MMEVYLLENCRKYWHAILELGNGGILLEYLFLCHGTGEKYVASIDEIGLIPKSRLYVHLSGDEETAVKVGKRHGKPVLYPVNSGKM